MIRSVICSDNQYVKLASSLQLKKFRDEKGLFSVEGVHIVQEALAACWPVEFVLIDEEKAADPELVKLLSLLDRQGVAILSLPDKMFKRVAETKTPQGILAVIRQQPQKLNECAPTGRAPVWLILDAVQDPGNVGTLVRTADAAGASGVMLAPGCADIYSGKTIRASMGSLFHLPVIKATVAECLAFCRQHQLRLMVADGTAESNYADENLSGPCAVVLGNEGAGVGAEFKEHANASLRIPILGLAESLNVASAAAVILFEAARQRGFSL